MATSAATSPSCLEIVNAGGNPDYDGVSGPLSFTDAGEPAEASFGILQFGEDNTIDADDTEYVFAGDEANAATDEGPAPAAAGDAPAGRSSSARCCPQTGNLAFLGPPGGRRLRPRRSTTSTRPAACSGARSARRGWRLR